MRFGQTCRGGEGDEDVFVALEAVEFRSGRDMAGPLDEHGHAETAFPRGPLLAAERRITGIGPHHHLVAVVGGVDDDGVVVDAQVFELLQEHADLLVMLEHLGAGDVGFGAAFVHGHLDILLRRMRPDMDGGAVEPDEEGLVALAHLVQVFQRLVEHFAIEGLHALARQLAVLFDLLLADAAKDRVHGRVIHVGRPGVQNVARTILLQVVRVLLAGVSELLRLLLGVEVIEIAIPLVEAVDGRQELIAVAQVVLAELARSRSPAISAPRPASGLPSGGRASTRECRWWSRRSAAASAP